MVVLELFSHFQAPKRRKMQRLDFWDFGRALSIIFWPKMADYIIYYLLSSKSDLVLYTQYHSTPVHRQNDRSNMKQCPFNPGWRRQNISKYTVLEKIIFLHYQGWDNIIIAILLKWAIILSFYYDIKVQALESSFGHGWAESVYSLYH